MFLSSHAEAHLRPNILVDLPIIKLVLNRFNLGTLIMPSRNKGFSFSFAVSIAFFA
jgi:hypothetical protein